MSICVVATLTPKQAGPTVDLCRVLLDDTHLLTGKHAKRKRKVHRTNLARPIPKMLIAQRTKYLHEHFFKPVSCVLWLQKHQEDSNREELARISKRLSHFVHCNASPHCLDVLLLSHFIDNMAGTRSMNHSTFDEHCKEISRLLGDQLAKLYYEDQQMVGCICPLWSHGFCLDDAEFLESNFDVTVLAEADHTLNLGMSADSSVRGLLDWMVEQVVALSKSKIAHGKYFAQRYRLFSLYDDGILMDEESWFSVTPEAIAQHVAQRCCTSKSLVIDVFCGVGGNFTKFSGCAGFVVGLDYDMRRLEMAAHNTSLYVDQLSAWDLVCADAWTFTRLLRNSADCCHLSPPWGGPAYLDSVAQVLDQTLTLLIRQAVSFCPEAVHIYLPKNTNLEWIVELAGQERWSMSVVQAFLNKKLKALVVSIADKK